MIGASPRSPVRAYFLERFTAHQALCLLFFLRFLPLWTAGSVRLSTPLSGPRLPSIGTRRFLRFVSSRLPRSARSFLSCSLPLSSMPCAPAEHRLHTVNNVLSRVIRLRHTSEARHEGGGDGSARWPLFCFPSYSVVSLSLIFLLIIPATVLQVVVVC